MVPGKGTGWEVLVNATTFVTSPKVEATRGK